MQTDTSTALDRVPADTASRRPEHAALVSSDISSNLADVLVMALDQHDAAGRPAIDLFSVLDAAEVDRAELMRIALTPEGEAAQAVTDIPSEAGRDHL